MKSGNHNPGAAMENSLQTPIISVDGLTARFGDDTIFTGVSFQVHRGEILVILGGSGCGKSTLLKHLIGLYQPAAGKVILSDIDMRTDDAEELRQVKMGMGVLFQSGALFGSMTLAENVGLPIQEYTDLSQDEIEAVVKMKLALVNLAGYENHLPEEISGGMKKRAGLARAMALDPSVLFFDEPSAGLDPISAAELDILIKSINAGMGTTMVVVTHELESIFSIAHRVIMLDKSARGIIAQGDPRELKDHSSDPRVSDFFNRRPGTGRQPKGN